MVERLTDSPRVRSKTLAEMCMFPGINWELWYEIHVVPACSRLEFWLPFVGNYRAFVMNSEHLTLDLAMVG
jgi:hypothetical protein